jgi:hypothetical protein
MASRNILSGTVLHAGTSDSSDGRGVGPDDEANLPRLRRGARTGSSRGHRLVQARGQRFRSQYHSHVECGPHPSGDNDSRYSRLPSEYPEETIVNCEERPSGQPEAIRSWFYSGNNFGEEFVYPKTCAEQLAKNTGRSGSRCLTSRHRMRRRSSKPL